MFGRIIAMGTPIGNGENTSGWRQVAAGLTAAAVVGADVWLVWIGRTSLIGPPTVPPVLALVSYTILYRGDLAAMGLRIRPVQGFRYWLIATVWIGAAIGALLLISLAAVLITSHSVRIYAIRLPDLWSMFVQMCVLAPIFEEASYRFGLCTGLVRVLGSWATIFLSGMIFGALHVLYGNPGPDDLIAGYFLAWAYLKSGTIVVPAALHSLGNFCALAAHFGTWYDLHGPYNST
jgi:uncharacterized protein